MVTFDDLQIIGIKVNKVSLVNRAVTTLAGN
jgi:hypothetical protein